MVYKPTPCGAPHVTPAAQSAVARKLPILKGARFRHRFLRNLCFPQSAEFSSVGDQALNSRFFVQLKVRLSEHVGPFADFVTFLHVENNYGSIFGQNST